MEALKFKSKILLASLLSLLFTTSSFTITGCVPAAFVAGASVGLVVYDQRKPSTIAIDKNIALAAQSKLKADKELYSQSHVTVAVFNGVMLLVGQTPTEELRERAEQLVRQYSGIKLLYNEIAIAEPVSNGVRGHDAWITAKVKSTLIATHGLNSASLKVVTENGVVYLMGMTTKRQGELAASKAQRISGVTKVVKLFEYVT